MTARLAALLACLIAACALATGCGQRGPLTLPDDTLETTEPQNGDETQDDEQEEEQ